MITEDEFLTLLDEELSLSVARQDLARDIDSLPGWDSLHVLRLLGVLEARTGRPLALTELLEARTLGRVLELAVRDA
ncbi:acyl carrier protein [Streptomyces rimosus]|uniref:acyl carrier protein n=1 Tax=Streptomyces rimosus TaxID=1927 RepID=UPI0004CC47C5|nr:phosphopantetheine-binding protein [Streptomyces rimosus]